MPPPPSLPPSLPPSSLLQVPYREGRAERVCGEYDDFIRRTMEQIQRAKEQVGREGGIEGKYIAKLT